LPLALAFFLHYRPRIRQAIPWREKLLSVFTLPHANLHILLGFGSILIALSIAISLSRGGMVSATLAVLICIILLQRSGQIRTRLMPIIACLIMVFLAMLWFGWEPILARFNSMTNSQHEIFDGRLLIWQDSVAMIRDFWLTGAGFGTFICLFPIYRNLMPGRGVVDHAHNDYIELVTDGGVIGLVLVAAFLGTVFWKSGRMLRKRRDDFPKILFSGCAASICAILIHSITDFNMHNGANGLYFFFLCGLLVSASHTRRRSSTAQSFLTSQLPPRLLMGFPVLLIAAATLLFNQGQARARVFFQPIATMYLNKNIPDDRLLGWQQQARKAQRADPLEGRYPFAVANISTFTGSYAAARKNYIRSLRLDPTQAAYLLQAGFYLGSIDNDAAISLLTAAARVDRTNADINKELANWLLRKGETDKGLARLREALALDRRQNNFSEYVAIALLNNLDLSVMEQVLPDQPLAHIQFANFLAKQGDVDMASFYYLNAMNFLDNDPETKPWFFHSAYWFFMNEKQYDNALAVIRKGLVYHPDDASMHILAGDVYRRLDIDYRAREQYRQALVIAPGNIRATRGLSALAREE
jgi:Tfp pilus assembly protein PilF